MFFLREMSLSLRMKMICISAIMFPMGMYAVSEDSATVHRIEVEAMPGKILHTNNFLKGYNSDVRTMNHSFVTHLKYSFSPPELSEQARIYKGVYQGVGLAFHNINSHLGNPVSLYVFQGATIKTLSERLALNYEWDLGLTYGWKPHDWEENPENHVIGSKMTAYIDLGLYLRWTLSNAWDINVGADLTHYSNGNTTIPNAGLNVASLKASVAYYVNRRRLKPVTGTVPHFDKHWVYDLTLYGAWKSRGVDTGKGTFALPDTYGVVGFTFNPLYRFNHWLNIGASLDGAFDGSANIEIDSKALSGEERKLSEDDVQIPNWTRRVALGLSARAEFVMPYFTINFGIGHNVVNANTEDMKGFYEILALKVNLMRKAYLHIGYSLYDFYYPNNLMLGIGLHL